MRLLLTIWAAKLAAAVIRATGRGTTGGERTATNKGVGACFAEVEVDTWTGNWRFVRAVYTHDTGLVINPLVSEADMVGSLVESTQVATDSIPWDREFPGTRPQPYVEHWDAAAWSVASSDASYGSLDAVSCGGPKSCLAVGYTEQLLGGPSGYFGPHKTFARRWNGQTWTRIPTPNPA